jgi:hypothetical protein
MNILMICFGLRKNSLFSRTPIIELIGDKSGSDNRKFGKLDYILIHEKKHYYNNKN